MNKVNEAYLDMASSMQCLGRQVEFNNNTISPHEIPLILDIIVKQAKVIFALMEYTGAVS